MALVLPSKDQTAQTLFLILLLQRGEAGHRGLTMPEVAIQAAPVEAQEVPRWRYTRVALVLAAKEITAEATGPLLPHTPQAAVAVKGK